MATRSINYKFNPANTVAISSYDKTKTSVGSLIKTYTGGPLDKFAAPIKGGFARPMEQATGIAAQMISIIQFSDNIDWVFYGDGAAAAVTRRVGLYEFDRTTSIYTWKGFITLNYPAAGNKTVRGQEVTRDLYTTGTVTCTGNTTLTGTSTAWLADRLAAGCRIGFGSTNPTEITTWYEIASITNDTTITLTGNGPVITDQPYVIEDLRVTQIITNSTTTNGGVHVVKGLRYELFTAAGNGINAATTIDNIRAVYWLRDATTVTNTLGYGIAIDEKASWTSQDAYVMNANAAASGRFFKYNLRASLSDLSAGATNLAYLLQTGQVATTGNIQAVGNGRIVNPQHGPGAGVKSIYWVTTTRIYRSALASILQDNLSYQTDAMIEVPPGTGNTFAATSVLNSIEYLPTIDRFLILTSGAGGVRNYITQYNTTSSPFDHIFMIDDKQLDQSLADPNVSNHPGIGASAYTARDSNGVLHACRYSTLATLNHLYTITVGADEAYAISKNQLLILPSMDVTGASKLNELAVNSINKVGSGTFSIPLDPYNVYYRTTGINDNTGGWTLLNPPYDLSGISATEIQFAISFKTIGSFCVPSRITSVNLIYEDNTTDSHYLPSVDKSSVVDKRFAYRQVTLFDTVIPELRIRVYNADTNGLVLDDNTTLQASGTFQYSTDGVAWNAWNASQNTIGNYIRYTAASLPDNIKVKVILTQ